MDFDKLRQQLAEATNSTKDHVHASYDYYPDHNNKPSKQEVQSHAHEYGGKSIKIHKIYHDEPEKGAAEVHVKGHVKHVMNLINNHHGENYSLDHAGHKKYKKDYS